MSTTIETRTESDLSVRTDRVTVTPGTISFRTTASYAGDLEHSASGQVTLSAEDARRVVAELGGRAAAPTLLDTLRENNPAFVEHMERNAAEVATWPAWKTGMWPDSAPAAPLFDPLSADYIKPWSQRMFNPENRNTQTAMEAEIADLRAALAQQVAPDQTQADEAELYRDLTGDAIALGYDGIPAALEALRKSQILTDALRQAAPRYVDCAACNGAKGPPCSRCGGSGKVRTK